MPRIIVNADDFGLTSGINRAILELHRAGLVTSASLMANANATDEAMGIARTTPTLGIGCHIVLVDGNPVLSAIHDIPNVADPAFNRLETSLPAFLDTIYNGKPYFKLKKRVTYQIEIEALAQIRKLQNAGLTLTHVDTHQHTHMFPRVLRPILRAAHSCGISRVRNPFEPYWAVRATTGPGPMRAAQIAALRLFETTWRRIITEEGFSTTDGTLVGGTGALDAATLRRLLSEVPEGTWELVTHPGYNDADLARVRTRLRHSRDVEREALHALRDFPSLDRISFANLDA